MAVTRNRIFTRDDGTDVEVDYEISGGSEPSGLFGLPEDYDPGSACEVTITDAWIESIDEAGMAFTTSITLTEIEEQRFYELVNEDPATWEVDDDYD